MVRISARKNQVPTFRVQQHRALAVPARPGFRREITFHDRTGIDVITLPPAVGLQEGVERAEFFLNQVVVVVAPGVAGESAGRRGLW